jgi:predicted nucleic acid-binding protein
VDAAIDERFTMVTSYHLVEELIEVLGRPRISAKYAIDTSRLAGLLEVLMLADVVPGIPGRRLVQSDPDDDWVVAPALEARVDAIVSEDWDLLGIGDIEGVPVLSAADFLEALRSAP